MARKNLIVSVLVYKFVYKQVKNQAALKNRESLKIVSELRIVHKCSIRRVLKNVY